MKRLTSATAIGVILAATPALAEVTPKSVWDNLISYYERSGLTVETEALDDAGDTLTARNLVLSQKSEDSAIVIEMGDLILSTTGDGAVRMDMADEAKIRLDMVQMTSADDAAAAAADAAAAAADAAADAVTDAVPDADAPPPAADEAATDATPGGELKQAMAAVMRISNEDITVREDGDAMVYAYMLPKLDIEVTEFTVDEGKVLASPFNLAMTNIKGNDRIIGTDGRQVEQSGAIEEIALNVDVKDDENFAKGQVLLTGFSVDSNSTLPGGEVDAQDLAAMLAAGLTTSGNLKIAKVTGDVQAVVPNETGGQDNVSIKIDSVDTALDFALLADRIKYAGSAGAGNFEMAVPDMPVPVGYSLTGSSFAVDFPTLAGEAPQNFDFSYALDGMTLADGVWSLFDPQGALPRDPANISVDLAGSVKVMRGLFDMAKMADPARLEDPNLTEEERTAIITEMMAPPVDLQALEIKKVALSLLGAKADVSGQLSAGAPAGMQTPVGTISGKFEGVNGLLDNLATAGLVPAEQMMGVRMMLAMFAKPDAQNPEIMTSELEFKEGGQIFANGQQVK